MPVQLAPATAADAPDRWADVIPIELSPDLVLEVLEPRHAEELFDVTSANRMHLREWLVWVDGARSVEDTRAFISATREQASKNDGFQAAIRYRGRLVGVIGYLGIDSRRSSTELGYWLAEDAQGQGLVTAACQALTEHAFDVLGLHRVEIRCAVTNIRSRAIPERLGFNLDGVLRGATRLHDKFEDLAIYSMLSEEWTSGAEPHGRWLTGANGE